MVIFAETLHKPANCFRKHLYYLLSKTVMKYICFLTVSQILLPPKKERGKDNYGMVLYVKSWYGGCKKRNCCVLFCENHFDTNDVKYELQHTAVPFSLVVSCVTLTEVSIDKNEPAQVSVSNESSLLGRNIVSHFGRNLQPKRFLPSSNKPVENSPT